MQHKSLFLPLSVHVGNIKKSNLFCSAILILVIADYKHWKSTDVKKGTHFQLKPFHGQT